MCARDRERHSGRVQGFWGENGTVIPGTNWIDGFLTWRSPRPATSASVEEVGMKLQDRISPVHLQYTSPPPLPKLLFTRLCFPLSPSLPLLPSSPVYIDPRGPLYTEWLWRFREFVLRLILEHGIPYFPSNIYLSIVLKSLNHDSQRIFLCLIFFLFSKYL